MSKYTSFEGFIYESESYVFSESDKTCLDVLRSEQIFERMRMNVDFQHIRIEQMTGRDKFTLGICNGSGKITLSKDVVSDFDYLRFVYLHELTHTHFMSHNARFGVLNLVLLARHLKITASEAFRNENLTLYSFQDAIIRNTAGQYLTVLDAGLNLGVPCHECGLNFVKVISLANAFTKSINSIEKIAGYLKKEVQPIIFS